MSHPTHTADVVVIGAGPAGSTAAALLAKEGHRVVVLEREKFPRYHIGESLITGCLPVLEELGLWERMDQIGFTRKYGATLLWGREVEPWGFRFADGGEYEHSYQVRRADFDALLLARARELGATVVEEATVKDVDLDGDRVVGATFTRKGSEETERVRATVVVDASGQGRVLGRRFDMVGWHEDLRNVAVWNYFQGCQLLDSTKAGDIIVENMPAGWFWFIPLHDGTVSVGYVTSTASLKETGLSPEQLFAVQREQSAEVKRLTEHAHQVNAFRTIRDWSYTCDQLHGPGWVLVGDAAAFIDPLLSTGVTLAMRGGRSAARAVDEVLRNPSSEEKVLDAYEASYRDFLGSILAFVRFFYNRTKLKDEYHAHAQELIDPAQIQAPHQDFATLLSGLADLIKANPGLDISVRD
jgi:flavin-dependent dehydrogenase